MRRSHTSVAVLGAGLTGMSAAFHLRQAGVPCRIFERQSRPGGHAVTIEERGYRFDRTGHLLHVGDAGIRALALGWMGPGCREVERNSVVYSHGVYTRYPFQANVHGLPPEVAYACVMGFLDARRARQEAEARGEASEPASFEQFCYQRFGRGISEHFMIPYNTRLWGVAPSEISAAWCARFVPEPTVEDVVAGAVGLRRGELGYNQRFLYPRHGIGQLSEGLAEAVGGIELSRAPSFVDAPARELVFDDERVGYDVLVSTAPLDELVPRIEGAPAPVLGAAAKLRCTHLHYLDLALRTPCRRPYHWVYVPEARYPFYRVGCYSHFSAEMAPPGAASLYVELVDRAPPDLPVVLPQVAAALVEMGLIDRPEAILFCRARRIDHAYVIFDHDYYPALETIGPYLEAQRVISAGRYGGWNYSSMGDALRFGQESAAHAVALLGGAER